MVWPDIDGWITMAVEIRQLRLWVDVKIGDQVLYYYV